MDNRLPLWQTFMCSSLAPAASAVLTNPIEVVKVRKQMDGELAKKGQLQGGTLRIIHTILRTEGIRAAQAGLEVAMFREASKNIFRIGLFRPFLNHLHGDAEGTPPIWKRMIAGMCSGATAAQISTHDRTIFSVLMICSPHEPVMRT